MANNVFSFPNIKQNDVLTKKDVLTKEDVDDNIRVIHEYHIEETLQAILPRFFENIGIAGFADDSDDNIRLCAMIVESIRALMYNHHNIYHPIQDISKQLFIPLSETEKSFTMSDSVNAIFKKEGDA